MTDRTPASPVEVPASTPHWSPPMTEPREHPLTAVIRLIEEAPFAHEKLTEAQVALMRLRDRPELDVERLARAISRHQRRSYIDMIDRTAAQDIASRYREPTHD